MHLAARRHVVSPLGTSRGHAREFEDFSRASEFSRDRKEKLFLRQKAANDRRDR